MPLEDFDFTLPLDLDDGKGKVDIFQNEELTAVFRKFLDKELSTENLKFFEKLRELPDRQQLAFKDWSKIYEEFIGPKSRTEVNVESATQISLTDLIGRSKEELKKELEELRLTTEKNDRETNRVMWLEKVEKLSPDERMTEIEKYFNNAADEMRKLVGKDTLRRFLKSEIYEEYVVKAANEEVEKSEQELRERQKDDGVAWEQAKKEEIKFTERLGSALKLVGETAAAVMNATEKGISKDELEKEAIKAVEEVVRMEEQKKKSNTELLKSSIETRLHIKEAKLKLGQASVKVNALVEQKARGKHDAAKALVEQADAGVERIKADLKVKTALVMTKIQKKVELDFLKGQLAKAENRFGQSRKKEEQEKLEADQASKALVEAEQEVKKAYLEVLEVLETKEKMAIEAVEGINKELMKATDAMDAASKTQKPQQKKELEELQKAANEAAQELGNVREKQQEVKKAFQEAPKQEAPKVEVPESAPVVTPPKKRKSLLGRFATMLPGRGTLKNPLTVDQTQQVEVSKVEEPMQAKPRGENIVATPIVETLKVEAEQIQIADWEGMEVQTRGRSAVVPPAPSTAAVVPPAPSTPAVEPSVQPVRISSSGETGVKLADLAKKPGAQPGEKPDKPNRNRDMTKR